MKFSTTLFQTGNNTSIEGASAGAATALQRLSPSAKKAHVTAMLGAKAAETRARRIAGIVTTLDGDKVKVVD